MTKKVISTGLIKTSTEDQILAGQPVDPKYTDNEKGKIKFRVEKDGRIMMSPDAQVAAGMPVVKKYTL